MAVQLRAVAETFIARRVKFHDGYTSDGFFPGSTRRETAPIYPRPGRGYPISSCFSIPFSIGIFLGCVAKAANTHLSFKQDERINSCSKIGEDR